MKIAVAIAHYYKYDPLSRYQSGRTTAEDKAAALKRCIQGIYSSLGNVYYGTDQVGVFERYHKEPREIDLTICTYGENHVLDLLKLNKKYYHVKKAGGGY